MRLLMNWEFEMRELQVISLGGLDYLSVPDLLDFLSERGTLVTEQLGVRATPLTDTEFLRGQFFEQEIIKNAILPPAQTT